MTTPHKFHASIEFVNPHPALVTQFNTSLVRAKPTRNSNNLKLEFVDNQSQIVGVLIDEGVKTLVLRTPIPDIIGVDGDRAAYTAFEYTDGTVEDQWLDLRRRDDPSDDMMITVVKILFRQKKVIDLICKLA